jgi:hypothetical protein
MGDLFKTRAFSTVLNTVNYENCLHVSQIRPSGKGKVPVLNYAPRHEYALGNGGIAPCIL